MLDRFEDYKKLVSQENVSLQLNEDSNDLETNNTDRALIQDFLEYTK